MKKTLTSIFVFISFLSSAQIDIENVLEGNLQDANTLLKNYLEPFPTALSYGMNTGWYSTANPHKILGFDISVVAMGALIPEENESFTFNNSDYTTISLDDGSTSSKIPTFFGSQAVSDRPLLAFDDGNGNTFSTSALPGSGLKSAIGFNAVPYAAVQLGLGIFKNTDLKVRFLPKQSADEYEVSAYGIGIMHDIKQWIPFVNKLPFSLSAFVAWDNVKSKSFLDFESNPTQALELNSNTFLYQLVASKKLAFLTVYGGLGMTSFNSDVNLLGTYDTQNSSFVDPISLAYSGSSFRANAGFSVKLFFLNINAGYTLQEYSAFNLGIGFTVR
jgi:hypothetical protein